MKVLLVSLVAAVVLAAGSQATTLPPYVAYVGCSVTWLTVGGYHLDGGTRLWPQNSSYDSGFPSAWAGSLTNRYWTAFNSMNTTYPGAEKVWWQLCVQTGYSPATLHENALLILDRIHAKLPGAAVYVSNLPVFLDQPCPTTGLDGIANGQSEADRLVGEGLAQAGPLMPTLSTVAKERYLGKTCHPNYKGQKKEGRGLLSFFG